MNRESKKTQSIGDEINLFISHINSLSRTLAMTTGVLQALTKLCGDTLIDFQNKTGIPNEHSESGSISIPAHHIKSWNSLKSQYDESLLAQRLVPRSILVALVSQYDAFLGRLLRVVFIARPELLNTSEKTFAFSQVARFDSIEAMKEHVIEKEIESILRSSHSDQFKWMESKFTIPLRKDLESWPRFIEITERRNLFVHTDGVVSSNYITNCKNHDVKMEDNIKEGDYLNVSQSYFYESYKCIFEIGVKLAHVLWRKFLPTEMEDADSNLNNLSFSLIEKGNYSLAITFLDFACVVLKKHYGEWHELVFTINRAQAYKWEGKKEVALQILDKYDWSAKGDEFKLAEAVLRENWTKSIEIMKRIGSNGPLNNLCYRDWPLFTEFRKEAEFLKTYEELFNEPFPISSSKESSTETRQKRLTIELKLSPLEDA